jgi:hypothetical protein
MRGFSSFSSKLGRVMAAIIVFPEACKWSPAEENWIHGKTRYPGKHLSTIGILAKRFTFGLGWHEET